MSEGLLFDCNGPSILASKDSRFGMKFWQEPLDLRSFITARVGRMCMMGPVV